MPKSGTKIVMAIRFGSEGTRGAVQMVSELAARHHSSGFVKVMTIFVGNLSFKAEEEDLRGVFAEYGAVKQIKIPVDRETGRKRGFAFVELESESDEQKAIDELDGANWMGRDLRVNKAQPRQAAGGGGGGRASSGAGSRNPMSRR
jgi:RNA recognition motif-containing protein